jgi:hypothetical protein
LRKAPPTLKVKTSFSIVASGAAELSWCDSSAEVAMRWAEGEEMTEQEELIRDIRERLGEMPKGALPFDLLAFVTTIGQRYSMTQNEIIRLVMQEAEALGVNYRIGSAGR